MRKASSPLPNIYIVNLSPSRPRRPFARIPVHWGRGNNRHFRVLRDTGSEPTLIPGDPNVTVSHQSERGLWESGDQWNIISSPSHSGLGDQWVPKFILWFFSPSSRMYNWNRHTERLAESSRRSTRLWGSEGHYGGKGQAEATRTASTSENSEPNAMLIPGGLQRLMPPSRT